MKHRLLFLLVFWITGCGIHKTANFHSETEASFHSALNRVTSAAHYASKDPLTWVVAIASAGCYFSGIDNEISSFASTETPVFGSIERAQKASDILLKSTQITYYAAFALRHTAGNPGLDLGIPITAYSTDFLAISLTNFGTGIIKKSGRLRPDTSDTRSFLSGHTSRAMVYSTVAALAINETPVAEPISVILISGVYLLSAATAWGRIEGKKHYISDVLAGAAFGHFLGKFVHGIFMGTDASDPVFSFQINPRNYEVKMKLQF